jgi:hypothetical protein
MFLVFMFPEFSCVSMQAVAGGCEAVPGAANVGVRVSLDESCAQRGLCSPSAGGVGGQRPECRVDRWKGGEIRPPAAAWQLQGMRSVPTSKQLADALHKQNRRRLTSALCEVGDDGTTSACATGLPEMPQLTVYEHQEIKALFDMLDEDGSGYIDEDELGRAFEMLGEKVRWACESRKWWLRVA